MIATRDIAAGEEVVNDYGSLSNAELLRAYGGSEGWGRRGKREVVNDYGALFNAELLRAYCERLRSSEGTRTGEGGGGTRRGGRACDDE